MTRGLVPVTGCVVKAPDGAFGKILRLAPEEEPEKAELLAPGAAPVWCPLKGLKSAFQVGMEVEHPDYGPLRPGLGTGLILATRTIADRDQVLVQFVETGETRWLPFETIRHVTSVRQRMGAGALGPHPDHAERFRMRALALALTAWDANTGAFGRLDIDPLPHQIHVARRVVTSGQPNWLIADDVGLGKTIEVGLIFHALSQRNRCRRVLVVCPAGLVKNWKDEMRGRFDRSFQIYGRDFTPEHPEEMKLHENVIVSLDLAKRPEHRDMLVAAGGWDVIVFDEAHRLGVAENGERTERYRLAEALRPLTPAMLLLTATPHQGKSRRFAALLELVRPDLAWEIAALEANPGIVGEIVIRNRKTRVTDAQGRPIFRGHDTRRVLARPSGAMIAFDTALRGYLRHGYAVGARGGARGRAIGFVMTTYRKLASSSIAAIHRALSLRRERLLAAGDAPPARIAELIDSGALEDADDLADRADLFGGRPFFENEIAEIDRLLALGDVARGADAKSERFLDEIVAPLLARNESILVFTEYRATQKWLVDRIASRFAQAGAVAQIHGSMSLDDKMENVRRFEERAARVLVSTEAGGEGLNLHRACCVMVNYDLPWNPSRLVQRIGRLYRYGQTRRVQVINLQADDGFDAQALDLMFERVRTIAADLAAVAPENAEALAADILGELLSNIDMEAILERADKMSISLTTAEIEAAIAAAQEAREAESEILAFADGHEGPVPGGLDHRHMLAFVEGMAPQVGAVLRRRSESGRLLELELPEALIGRFPEFGRRRVVQLTLDAALARRRDDVFPLDFRLDFVSALARRASERRFDGLCAAAEPTGDREGWLTLWRVRWQDAEGRLLEEGQIPMIGRPGEGWRRCPDDDFAALLLLRLASVPEAGRCSAADLASLDTAVMREVARTVTFRRHPGALSLAAALDFAAS
jgi:superfamily II DNA or RNA helicase